MWFIHLLLYPVDKNFLNADSRAHQCKMLQAQKQGHKKRLQLPTSNQPVLGQVLWWSVPVPGLGMLEGTTGKQLFF